MPNSRKAKGASREVEISKSLSYLLRHGAKIENITLDEAGWANVADVLVWRRIASLKVDLAELQSVVASNDKKRYQIELDPAASLGAPSAKASTSSVSDSAKWRIRATQGHSISTIASEHIFKPILLTDPDCPDFVVHGTDDRPWIDIERSGGLKPMRRNHIHFATKFPEKMPDMNTKFQSLSKPKEGPVDKVISGMRITSTVVIWVDVKKSLKDGVKWWRSENDVILTEGVGEPKMLRFEYFQWVERRGDPPRILYGERVESEAVRQMENRMDRLGIGFENGEKVSQVDRGKAPPEEGNGEEILQKEETLRNGKHEPASVVKDHWDD